jgi:hypothetical protein
MINEATIYVSIHPFSLTIGCLFSKKPLKKAKTNAGLDVKELRRKQFCEANFHILSDSIF